MILFAIKRARSGDKSRHGNAMLLVMMMSVFSMGIWAVTLRTTRNAIETESFHNQRTEFEHRIVRGLALAGVLLEKEKPDSLPYAFLYTGKDANGSFFTRVEIRSKGHERFSVTARKATVSEVRSLPRNPKKF